VAREDRGHPSPARHERRSPSCACKKPAADEEAGRSAATRVRRQRSYVGNTLGRGWNKGVSVREKGVHQRRQQPKKCYEPEAPCASGAIRPSGPACTPASAARARRPHARNGGDDDDDDGVARGRPRAGRRRVPKKCEREGGVSGRARVGCPAGHEGVKREMWRRSVDGAAPGGGPALAPSPRRESSTSESGPAGPVFSQSARRVVCGGGRGARSRGRRCGQTPMAEGVLPKSARAPGGLYARTRRLLPCASREPPVAVWQQSRRLEQGRGRRR